MILLRPSCHFCDRPFARNNSQANGSSTVEEEIKLDHQSLMFKHFITCRERTLDGWYSVNVCGDIQVHSDKVRKTFAKPPLQTTWEESSQRRGWAERKPKVWFRSRNFGFWIKLSVSVGFGFCRTARFWRQTVKTAKKKAERFFFLHLFQKVKAKYWIPLSELKVRFCFHFLK